MSHKMLASFIAVAAMALPATAWSFKLQKPEITKKGTFTFGGGLNLSFLTTETEVDVGGTKATSEVGVTGIGIAPNIGYYVMDALEIGLMLDYHSSTLEPEEGDDIETSGYAAGLYGAYYFNFLEKNALYPYVGVSVAYQSDAPNDDTTVSGTDIRPGLGLMLAVGSRTGGFMKLGLDYQIQSLTTEVDGDEVSTQSTSGVVVGLGFGLYLQ